MHTDGPIELRAGDVDENGVDLPVEVHGHHRHQCRVLPRHVAGHVPRPMST